VTYFILAPLFFLSLLWILFLLGGAVLIWLQVPCSVKFYRKYHWEILAGYLIWFIPYGIFVIFATGPRDSTIYPPVKSSPYRLPWAAGVEHFVSQGNRSFTSHRDFYEFSWDFCMRIGTEILAAREGKVIAIDDSADGIGLHSNFVTIEHPDGTRAMYVHIRQHGALVLLNQMVAQGERIALSGMVGQTINPHLHFAVINAPATTSIPISFHDIAGDGVPRAGHFYDSGNRRLKH
jgi:murein DD-endopeptidase MepM/ murein hydrolase activator NlpD